MIASNKLYEADFEIEEHDDSSGNTENNNLNGKSPRRRPGLT